MKKHPRSLSLALALSVASPIFVPAAARARGEEIHPAHPERRPAGPESKGDHEEQAREHWLKGNKLFDLQRYRDAAKEYELAFELKEDAAFLFNMGQALRFEKEYARAISAYRSYLRRVPAAPARATILGHIDAMQKLVEEQRHTQDRPPAGTMNPQQSETKREDARVEVVVVAPHVNPKARVYKIAGLSLAGIGVLGLASGGALTGVAHAGASAYNHPQLDTTYDASAPSRIRAQSTAGAVMLGIGGAALVGGATLAILGWRLK